MDNKKLEKLQKILKRYKKVLIAFSGGVDSSFLSKIALDTLGRGNVVAVTADSATYPRKELKEAKGFAKKWGIKHLVIKTNELKDKNFLKNPHSRCFYCKDELFSSLKKIAYKKKIRYVLDASNNDDLKDFRPGSKAKKLHNIHSPLEEAGFTKKDIRYLSKKIGLSTYSKPSLACLASRIAYYEPITLDKLQMIGKAEAILHNLGFKQCRVRIHNSFCRIELEKKDIKRVANPKIYDIIMRHFRKFGFKYITLDLEGFRSGSMNLEIQK